MGSVIQIVDETPLESAGDGDTATVGAPATLVADVQKVAGPPPPAAPVEAFDPRLPKIAQEVQARLQALEGAVQGLPRAHTVVRALLAALGLRILAFLALLACIGLAGVEAYSPSWPLLATFGMMIVGVLLPLVYVAYRGQ